MTRRTAKRINITVAFAVIPLIVGGLTLILQQNGALFRLEALAYDQMISSLASDDPAGSPVVIIGINEEDIRSWRQYPVSDKTMNRLLTRLLQGEPSTIGIDVYRDWPVADRDAEFAANIEHAALMRTVMDHPGIVVVERPPATLDDREFVPPPERLSEGDPNQQVGSSVLAVDQDGKIRRALPFVENYRTGGVAISLGFVLAFKHLAKDELFLEPVDPDDELTPLKIGAAQIGRPRFPIGMYRTTIEDSFERGEVLQYMVDYRSPVMPTTFSFTQVMSAPFDVTRLRDKIVIIGITAKSVKDLVNTPHGHNTFGFVMHGYIADQLVRWAKGGRPPPVFAGDAASVGWVVFWSLLGGIIGGIGKTRSPWRMVLFVLVAIALLFSISYVLLENSIVVPFVPPLLAVVTSTLVSLAYISAVDRRDQRIVEQLMDMHISRPVAEQLLDNRDAFFKHGKLQPQRTTATVLFSDLMDFTPIAEHLDSTQLMNWLNDFFQEMTDAVDQCGGVVNKFNGDMVMALFGPPHVRESEEEIAADARAAVRCAVLMRKALARMNRGWAERGMPTPRMRIGIFTGPLVAGSLGGKNRVEYTVIGDTVNTASRLESSNKECMDDAVDGTRIIIGDATCRALGQDFVTRPAGSWGVKGKSDALVVHAVLDHVQPAETRSREAAKKE